MSENDREQELLAPDQIGIQFLIKVCDAMAWCKEVSPNAIWRSLRWSIERITELEDSLIDIRNMCNKFGRREGEKRDAD